MAAEHQIIPVGQIEQTILLIRGQRVILDADLARLYGVPTKRLNEAVRRNAERFPDDFAFRVTWDEARILRSQIATLATETDDSEGLRSQSATSKTSHHRYAPENPPSDEMVKP
jgi:hypothetical protein